METPQSPLGLADDDDETTQGGDETLQAGSDDYSADSPPMGSVSASGGLKALDIPGAAEAFATMARSSKQARAALAKARAQIVARRYSSALPLLAISSALGKSTRTGSIGETFGNVSEALAGPLREKEAFEQARQKELLGIDTSMAGLDERTGQAQLQLAQLRAQLAAKEAALPNDRVIGADGKVYWRARPQARNSEAWVPAASSTNVNLKEESAESKGVGEGMAKHYNTMLQSGIDANAQIAKYERLSNLMEGMKTSKLTPTFATIAAVADSFGITLDKRLGAKQAAEALTNEIALTLRNPAGGAGMPGALSDADREYLKSMTPGIGKTPEGNRLIIETAIKLAQRDQDVARMARAYRKKHGHMSEDFFDELDEWSRANPLFPKKQTAAPASVSAPPAAAATEEGAAPPPAVPAIPSGDDAVAISPGTVSFYNLPKQ